MATQAPELHHWSRRVSAVCRRRARGHDSCSGIDGASCQSDCEGHRGMFHSWSRGHAHPAVLPLETGTAKCMLMPMPTLRRPAQPKDGVWSVAKLGEMPRRRHTPGQHFHANTVHLDGHDTEKIHLPLLTATLVLQLEPGKRKLSARHRGAYTPAEGLSTKTTEKQALAHITVSVQPVAVHTGTRKTGRQAQALPTSPYPYALNT